MSDTYSKPVNIFLTVDSGTIQTFFNENDPAPLYKRQLSHKLEQYIALTVVPVKRYSPVFYKLQCKNESPCLIERSNSDFNSFNWIEMDVMSVLMSCIRK